MTQQKYLLSFILFTLLTLLNGCSSSSSGEIITGKASYYHNSLHGNMTANGEIYNKNALTCAHKKLAFGTRLKVTNLSNNKKVIVKVNDRGPFVKGRIIDLSYKAMQELGGIKAGVIDVKAEILK